jgi:hypothetical protein
LSNVLLRSALKVRSAGENMMEAPLPTALPPIPPRSRRALEKRPHARTVFDVVFNTALVVSALILTFIVLVREEQYAFGHQLRPAQVIEQLARQSQLDVTGSAIIPPSN